MWEIFRILKLFCITLFDLQPEMLFITSSKAFSQMFTLSILNHKSGPFAYYSQELDIIKRNFFVKSVILIFKLIKC